MACVHTYVCSDFTHAHAVRPHCKFDLTRSGLGPDENGGVGAQQVCSTALSKDSRKSMALSCMALSNPIPPEIIHRKYKADQE